MSLSLLFVGALLGMDSLVAGTALGMVRPARVQQSRLALAFALCDGLGYALGSAGFLPASAASRWFEPLGILLIAGYAALVLALALWGQRSVEGAGTALPCAFVVPLALSLDNFVAGVAHAGAGSSAVATALAFSAASGGLAWAGLLAGAAFAHRLPVRDHWLRAGALAVLVGVTLCH